MSRARYESKSLMSGFANYFPFLLRILAPKIRTDLSKKETFHCTGQLYANNDFSCPVALGEGSLLRRPRWHIPTPRPPDIGELSKLLAY